MDRVEKVARAIAKANRRNPDTPLWDSSNKKAWEVYYFDARAAIAAIEDDVREEIAKMCDDAPAWTEAREIGAAIRKGGKDE